MIRLTDRLPELTEPDAVGFKLHALFDCYADTALFWTQESRDTCFGLLDGHLILSAKQPVDQELRHFVSFLSPKSIFTHPETLASLGLTATETVFVLAAKGTPGEVLSLRDKADFCLLAIDADRKIRYERILQRNSETDHVSFEQFVAGEEREMHDADPNKQNISKCIEMADFLLNNNGNREDLYKNVEKILEKIL